MTGKHFHGFSDEEKASIQLNLDAWYTANKRELPWRTLHPDADVQGYRTWISEVMLQQTQVKTVLPYFSNWMESFPNIQSLATAELGAVYAVWAGLGYYSRARRLHEAARHCTAAMGGVLPRTAEELLKLPGIGPYTAGAISSIAFGAREPAVDGNVVRVLSRLRAVYSLLSNSKSTKLYWALAGELVPDIISTISPGDWTQAVMELGATVCTPKNPKCSDCPVRNDCWAFSMETKKKSLLQGECDVCLGDIEDFAGVVDFPAVKPKKKSRIELALCCVVISQGKTLLIKRPEKGLLAGQWEFPTVVKEVDAPPDNARCLETSLKELLDNWGTPSASYHTTTSNIGSFTHIFSHINRHIFVQVYCCDVIDSGDGNDEESKWVPMEDLPNMKLTSILKKVIKLIDSKKNQKDLKDLPPGKKQRKLTEFFK